MSLLNFLTAPSRSSSPVPIRIALLGRANSGKTTSLTAMFHSSLERRLPSGNKLSADDPRKVNEWRNEENLTRRELCEGKLASTVAERSFRFRLSRGPVSIADVSMVDPVGQVLTSVTSSSPHEEQEGFKRAAKRLAQADVIQVTFPVLPANPTAADRSRHLNDLKVVDAWLDNSFLSRGDRPVNVAVLATKLDAAYPSLEDARENLTPEALQDQFDPILRTLETFDIVKEAAVFPVSAFGMGNSIAIPALEAGLPVTDLHEVPETNFRLDRDSGLEPFNYEAVVIWSLLVGLMQQDPAAETVASVEQAVKDLAQDFLRTNSWCLPIRGYLSQLS